MKTKKGSKTTKCEKCIHYSFYQNDCKIGNILNTFKCEDFEKQIRK